MKIKKFMAMMIAAATLCAGMSSCGDDDDDDDQPANTTQSLAKSLAGDYTGVYSLTVSTSTSTDTVAYSIKMIDDTHVSLTTPSAGSGAMALPSITIDNIPVSSSTVSGAEVISASLSEVSGTIVVNGAEKSYKFSDLVIAGTGNKVSIAYSLQYGKMPMAMVCAFTGEK